MNVLPPDSRLRKPKRPLPRGTVDCHAHIFDRVERGVQVHGSPYGFDNAITEDFLQEYRGRFVGVAAVPPEVSDSEIKKLNSSGFRAARLMDQFATGATTKDLEAIASRIAPYGWHIEINIAKSADWVALEPRLKRCPVPMVFDHLGRVRGGEGINAPGFTVIRRMLSARDDCWTKISSWYRLSDAGPPHYEDMKPLAQALLRERPERCVWGTNWPHPGLTETMPNDADLVDQLESWLPNEARARASVCDECHAAVQVRREN
jgi:predicted TIM-barrel fold metal-dependent hydrolase